MTVNKAQGQTFERVGIYLPSPVFSHGQLYVAFSLLSTTITDLLNVISRACVCPGNPEENSVEICNKRGGTMHGERGFDPAVAYIDRIEGKKVTIEVIMYMTTPCTV